MKRNFGVLREVVEGSGITKEDFRKVDGEEEHDLVQLSVLEERLGVMIGDLIKE